MHERNMHTRQLAVFASIATILSVGLVALGDDTVHPVLARYPTRDELQGRIDQAKRSDADAFEEAIDDFGEAIRLSRSLSGPPWPGKRSRGIPHVKPGPVLSDLKTPAMWAMSFKKADKIEPGSDWVRFYRAHLDELTLDASSIQCPLVLMDVVLNGWHDWNDWDDEKLVELREKFPELHRVYAMRELLRTESLLCSGG